MSRGQGRGGIGVGRGGGVESVEAKGSDGVFKESGGGVDTGKSSRGAQSSGVDKEDGLPKPCSFRDKVLGVPFQSWLTFRAIC